MERRLAAIPAADVAGCSRMTSEDDIATLATLQLHQSELPSPTISRHRGRIVKLMGDGILAEFGGVVEAVHCTIEIQREMSVRNRARHDAQHIAFRIGAHVGDVIVDNDDIHGDGVNIAGHGLGRPLPEGATVACAPHARSRRPHLDHRGRSGSRAAPVATLAG
mgnify:CR=1 FL=1